MHVRRKVLAFGQLPSSKGDIYVPVAANGRAQNILLHNTGATPETVVLNYDDGSAEYQWLSQSIAAGDTLTLSLPGAGDTVESGGKITGNTDTASTVTYKVSGVEEYVPGYVASNLWSPPVTPHPMDDEFNDDDLSDWGVHNATADVVGSFGLDAIDAYDTGFTTGNVLRGANNTVRQSWLLLQPPASSQTFWVYKPYTLPTDLLMWSRMRFNMTRGTMTNNDDWAFIQFMTDVGDGTPGGDYRVTLYLNENDAGTVQAQAQYTTTSTAGIVASTNTTSQGQALEYVAIHKLGSTYHMWVGTAAGNWIWMTSYSLGFTPDMVGFGIRNGVATGPGPGVHGIDFIRFIETDNFLL